MVQPTGAAGAKGNPPVTSQTQLAPINNWNDFERGLEQIYRQSYTHHIQNPNLPNGVSIRDSTTASIMNLVSRAVSSSAFMNSLTPERQTRFQEMLQRYHEPTIEAAKLLKLTGPWVQDFFRRHSGS